jgi:hypothetical protein
MSGPTLSSALASAKRFADLDRLPAMLAGTLNRLENEPLSPAFRIDLCTLLDSAIEASTRLLNVDTDANAARDHLVGIARVVTNLLFFIDNTQPRTSAWAIQNIETKKMHPQVYNTLAEAQAAIDALNSLTAGTAPLAPIAVNVIQPRVSPPTATAAPAIRPPSDPIPPSDNIAPPETSTNG